MSTASRLISGSAASWARILVTMVSQIVLVPIYLTHWNVKTYGIWLAIQALISVLSTLDLGHQTYLGYEFLRFGKDDRKLLSQYMWSGIVIGIVISLGQLALIVGFIATGWLPSLLGESSLEDMALMESAGIVLVIQSVTWLVSTSTTGVISRALAPFGYYPRMAWWGFAYGIITAVAPLIAVVLGGDLLVTGIAAAAGAIAYSIPCYVDIFNLLRKEQIYFTKPSWTLGYNNFVRSIALFAKSLFEIIRQQGVRLILSPLTGAAGLAAFSTIRTGANVALQGLNTVMNPLMPDLMRFLHDRDQARSEVGFGTIWIVVIAFMAPGVVILQAIIEPFYVLWTQGKIPFDPALFAFLSVGVLVYAVIQPAMAVVIGNNLVRPQLALSAMAAAIVAGGTFASVPFFGILGAGMALLTAEIASSIGYIRYAKRWLTENELQWPHQSFRIALASVIISTAAMAGMILLPQLKWVIFAVSMVMLGANFWRYWQVLPLLATQRARHLIGNLPFVKRFFFV